MTTGMIETLLGLGSSVAVSVLVKATVAVVMGLVGVWLARRARASVRHALVGLTFLVLLVLPLAEMLGPQVRVSVPVEVRVAEPVGRAVPVVAAVEGGVPLAEDSGIRVEAVLFGVWVVGVVLFLLPIGLGLHEVRALRRGGSRWADGEVLVQSSRVRFLVHESLSGPMTFGVVRPVVMFPAEARVWEAEALRRALVHELEHVRRVDWLVQCLARVVCAVYWFHPLVWVLWRRLVLEAERACDDAVLEGSEAVTYADQLVEVAGRVSRSGRVPVLAMANRGDLGARVRAVLDAGQRRGRVGWVAVGLLCLGAVIVVGGLSPLAMVAAPQVVGRGGAIPSAPRFAGSGSLVSVATMVTDGAGKSVEGLRPEDFVIRDNGAEQPLRLFRYINSGIARREASADHYLLGFRPVPTSPGERVHQVRVELLRTPGVTIRHRQNYYPQIADSAEPDYGPSVPVPVYRPEADYSDEAAERKFQGTSTISAVVDSSGAVSSVRVVRPLGLGLDEKAVEAVRQWRFRPARVDGRAVAAEVQVAVYFRLM